MKRFINKFKFFLMALLFTTVTAASSVGPVYAATGDPNPMPWTGQGTTSGSLTTVQCSGDTATPGTLLWVFTLGGGTNTVTSAALTLGGSGSGTYQMESSPGNQMKVVTPYYNLSTLSASVSYVGNTGNGAANLVISHGCPPAKTSVTPAVVTVDEECGIANDTFDIPDNGNGVTYTHTYVGGVLTVTATPDSTHTLTAGNGFTLNGDGTATFTYTFTNEDCESTTPVTLVAVTVNEECGRANDSFTIPSNGNGVTYTYTYVRGVLTVTATPDADHTLVVGNSGFTLNQDGTATFTYTFTNTDCPPVIDLCKNIEGNQTEVPNNMVRGEDGNCYKKVWVCKYVGIPGVNERLKSGNDGLINVSVNSIEHNRWDGSVPGWFSDAQDRSYVLAYDNGQPKPSLAECPQPSVAHHVHAPRPMFKDLCGMEDDTFTIPSKQGVEYSVNGHVLAAGTYDASDYDVNGTVTITASALAGYQLNNRKHEWSFTFTNADCGHGGQVTPVTPAAVTFKDICATANDTYTIPSTVGVEYWVNGAVKPAGTYAATGTISVTAMPASAAYSLTGAVSWSHTFTNASCGQVLGESTTIFTPAPQVGRGGGEVLANTGSSTLVTSLAAFFLIVSSILLYAYNPKYDS